MNQLFLMLGLETWKPVLTALVLPPVPFLLMILVGRLVYRRRLFGWLMVLFGLAGIWGCSTMFAAQGLMRVLMPPLQALSAADLAQLKRGVAGAPKTTILVLGGGRDLYAPEYGMSNLSPLSMERLRYGLWLGRETGQPVGFSGGLSPGSPQGASEAEIATRIAANEFGRPLQWSEGESRDTGENAARSVSLLAAQGYERIVIVTHDFHMARAVHAFDRARQASGKNIDLVRAPVGLVGHIPTGIMALMPTWQGTAKTRLVLREALGRLAGA